MAKSTSGLTSSRTPPARSPEAREQEMMSLAMDLVEKRLREGTATSQETTHFLKLASTRQQQEQMLLEEEIKLKRAKTEAIESGKNVQELYTNAIKAMSTYRGLSREEDIDE